MLQWVGGVVPGVWVQFTHFLDDFVLGIEVVQERVCLSFSWLLDLLHNLDLALRHAFV